MLQKARSSSSRSFMREAEFSKLILDNGYEEEYFKEVISEVVQKRKNPDVTYTGAKALREQLLSCLMQKGEIKTANVWARLAPTELLEVEFLLETIEERLRAEKDIFGAVELHLADREILSPHIQYVGTNAQKAELIIAQTLVELKYEVSIESAIGKKYEDYEKPYEVSNNIPVISLDKVFEEQKKHREETKEIQDILAEIDRMQEEFLSMFYKESQSHIKEAEQIREEVLRKAQGSQYVEDFIDETLDEAQEELDDEIERMIDNIRRM